GDVLQADAPPGDELSVLFAGHGDVPQLLGAAAVDRRRLAHEHPFPDRTQEVGRVVDPHAAHQASLHRPQGRAGRGQRLDEGAVEATVHDPVGLMVVGTHGHAPDAAVGGRFGDLDVTVGDVVDSGVKIDH